MVGYIFANGGKAIAVGAQHLGGTAIGGRGVGKIIIDLHVQTLHAGKAAQDGIQCERSAAIVCPILV